MEWQGFEVKLLTGRGRRYTMNLQKRRCSCGYFQLAGLPCSHAISAIYKCGKDVDAFIDKCYSVEELKKIMITACNLSRGRKNGSVSEPKARGTWLYQNA
jgi:hypothetical protein